MAQSIQSIRPNWVHPPPHPQGNVTPSPFGPIGGDTLAFGGGGVELNATVNQLQYLPSMVYVLCNIHMHVSPHKKPEHYSQTTGA
jgi:hypothetical protein